MSFTKPSTTPAASCWREYLEFIPAAERGDMMQAYYTRLTSPDPKMHRAAAKIWSVWEGRTSRLIPDPDLIARQGRDDY